MKMKKKLFFGLAVAPSVLIAPVVVSCTDKEEEKTKEIDKQNIEKFSSLIKDLTPTLVKNSNENISSEMMDTITQSVDEQIKFVINYVNTIINTHPMITENLKGEILYYINTALDLFLPYASKIVDTIKKSPDINIIEFIKTEENKESLKDILKKLCTIMFSRMKNNTDKYKKIIAEFLKAEHKESLINDFEEWLNNKESQAQFENEINKSLDQMFLVLEDLNANNLEKYEEILKKLTEFLNFNTILLGTRAINL